MSKFDKLLSVIIPTFNGDLYIEKTINSVLSQVDERVEVLVIDDSSSDKTIDIITEKYSEHNVVLHLGSGCRNWVSSSNFGLLLAKGKYLTFLHQDDLWESNRYETFLAYEPLMKNCVMYINPSHFISGQDKKIGKWLMPFSKNGTQIINWPEFLNLLIVQNFIAIPSVIFSRERALAVGPMREDLWYTADWDYWLRLADKQNILFNSTIQTSFRLHKQSQTVIEPLRRGAENFFNQLEHVQSRYLTETRYADIIDMETRKLANLSTQLNTILVCIFNNLTLPKSVQLNNLLGLLHPRIFKLLRATRLHERVLSRIRIFFQ